ncbi:O-methyltransferase [Flavisphingomonas formosensis]|uniref:O-methyltransferase n=1 Tax=Flavisphingomonas formosensis TaxID=861534 RepID=UPI0012F9DFB0|nr:O-methyltransferase [Sphingomonas formosensis]
MAERDWYGVDDYISRKLASGDEALDAALAANAAAGLPAIDVSAPQGKLLGLYARMIGARHILEIGTLGGYSTICLARALPADGRLVTLEIDPHHAEVARSNIAHAGLADRVDIRVGPARRTLDAMRVAGEGPFDLVFIDADKPSNPDYFAAALAMARSGTVIICDNVVRDGRVIDAQSTEPAIVGTRALFDILASDARVDATAIQTVGSKGWDGFAIAIVK